MSLDQSLDAVDAALQTLADFIECNIEGLTVYREWPYGNQVVAMPSITITTGKNIRTPEMPWVLSQTPPDFNNKIVVTEVVANYDTEFQIDLWTKNKLDRTKYLSLIIALFNSQQTQSLAETPNTLDLPDGLSLPMKCYFGDYARFEIESHEIMDDEAGAQRQERRVKIMVIVNVREIRQRMYYAMKKIQASLGTGSSPDEIDITEEEDY